MQRIEVHSAADTDVFYVKEFTPYILLAMCWVQGRMNDLGDGHFEIHTMNVEPFDKDLIINEDEVLESLALHFGEETEEECREWVEIVKCTWDRSANHY